MKKLEQLVKEANPLRSYASDLETAITKVALVCDNDDDEKNIFPAKKDVIETMANAVEKMREVSLELDSFNGVTLSDWDAVTLSGIREFQPDCKQSVDRLGVVLEDMVNMLDLDGSGIDVFLIQYVVSARQCLRAILQLLDDPGPEEISSDGQK
jgi:hypothetical protein